MSVFTASQRRSLVRISGSYVQLSEDEPPFTCSDAVSLGVLCQKSQQSKDDPLRAYYQKAYQAVCTALQIPDPELFLVRLHNMNAGDAWDDFSDFKAVWYPKWFENQLDLRAKLFQFTDEEPQKIKSDFWGETSPDESLKKQLLDVRDSFKQIRVGVLALVFKIDDVLATLLGWQNNQASVTLPVLKEKFSFPASVSKA